MLLWRRFKFYPHSCSMELTGTINAARAEFSNEGVSSLKCHLWNPFSSPSISLPDAMRDLECCRNPAWCPRALHSVLPCRRPASFPTLSTPWACRGCRGYPFWTPSQIMKQSYLLFSWSHHKPWWSCRSLRMCCHVWAPSPVPVYRTRSKKQRMRITLP